jgi:hypothetical protein
LMIVKETWRGLIANESEYDWIKLGRVLVGTEPRPDDFHDSTREEEEGEDGEEGVSKGEGEEGRGRRRDHEVNDEHG